jgi:hypothetical protein
MQRVQLTYVTAQAKWQMSHNGQTNPPGHFPPINVPAGDDANFQFTITNPQGVTFANNPIWIQKGTVKPTGGVDTQITGIAGQGTKILTFNDSNADAGPLSYVLHFNGAPQLDPIIQNGGGGVSEEPPPPPPPPPPEGPGVTGGTGSSTPPPSSGLLGGFDAISLVIGLIIGFVLAGLLFKWGK